MDAQEASLYELLEQARLGDDPTAVLDATCLAIVEELALDTGPLCLPDEFSWVGQARRTIVVESARRVDVE